MSVILDALKKAEAGRQQDGVPELRGAQNTARLAIDRQRRLWFVALFGTLICTGAAWFTFVEQPRRLNADPITAQETSQDGGTLDSASQNPAQIALAVSDSGELQQAKLGSSASPDLLPSGSEGATLVNSEAFLPASTPQILQMSTAAAKRSSSPNSDFAALPTLSSPNTGAAQPIFAQLPVPNGSASTEQTTEPALPSIDSQSMAVATLTAENTGGSEAVITTNSPAPELVLQAAQQTTAAAASIPELYQLDYQTRNALPKLGLTVHVFDVNPTRSFVIVNNKRFNEGEQIDGTVLIAKIRRDGVECEFKGKRFLLPRQL